MNPTVLCPLCQSYATSASGAKAKLENKQVRVEFRSPVTSNEVARAWCWYLVSSVGARASLLNGPFASCCEARASAQEQVQ